MDPGRDGTVDQAEPLEFLERLVDLADQAAAGHRGDDMVGHPPAQVLGDLEADGLGALGVERPEVDVDESPAEAEGDLRAEAVDLVVVALDGDDLGAVDGRAQDLALLEIVGDEDVSLEAGGRRRWPRRCWRDCPWRRSRPSGNPSSTAFESATATTRSLNESVG